MNSLFTLVLFCMTLFLVAPSQADTATPARVEKISGIEIDKTVQVSSGNKTTTLKLNGAGFRNKIFFFRVYIAALYLMDTTRTVKGILDMPGPKQMNLIMLRTLKSEVIKQGIKDGVEKNTSQGIREKLSNQFHQMDELFSLIPDLKKGDVLSFQWMPGEGTNVLVNGKKLGKSIPDIAFFNALLHMWIGPSPVDSSLKKQLIGGSEK